MFIYGKKFPFSKRVWMTEEIAYFEDLKSVLDGVMIGISIIRILKENEQW